MRNPYVIVVILVIAAITVWRLAVLKKKPTAAEQAALAARPDAGPPPPAPGAPATSPPGPTKAALKPNASPERAAADKLRAEIAAARARRLASAPPAPRPTSAPPAPAGAPTTDEPPGLDKDYIREQVQVILPLLQECYEQALERSPSAGGRVTVTFSIAGEPELGGAVEASDLVKDKTDISDPEFAECVTETMFAAQFRPPADGGSVEVTYPFEFATTAPTSVDGGPPR